MSLFGIERGDVRRSTFCDATASAPVFSSFSNHLRRTKLGGWNMSISLRGSNSFRMLLLGAVASGFIGATAFGAPLNVLNPSFESPAVADNQAPAGDPTDWAAFGDITGGNSGVENPGDAAFPGTTGDPGTIPGGDGVQNVYINQVGPATNGELGIFQNIDAAAPIIASDTVYTLTVGIGNALNVPDETFAVRLVATSPAGSTTIAEATGNADTYAPQGRFLDISAASSPLITNNLVGNGLQIQLVNTNSADFDTNTLAGIQVNFDNVRVDASPSVPEPTALGFFGIIGLTALGRRRRQQGA
jgi:hypothetical protein